VPSSVPPVAHARADLRDAMLGNDEDPRAVCPRVILRSVPAGGAAEGKARVEALGDVAHELEVLALVLADGHLVRAVGEHVGGLQHRVQEQPRGGELALRGRLVAELVHALQLAVRRDRRQQPAQVRVLVDVALAKEDAAFGIEAGREQQGGGVEHPQAQVDGVVGQRRRVQVHDAVDRRIAAILPRDVLRDRADVVAEVLAAGRLDAAEDDGGHARRMSRAARRVAAAPPAQVVS
jgi:hypothetical protein